MAGRLLRTSLRDALSRRTTHSAVVSGGLGKFSSAARNVSASKVAPPPPPSSRKGRLLTGAMIGLAIAGGAYVSTADEATFCGWMFNATKLLNPVFARLDAETAHNLAILAASRGVVPKEKRPDPPILGIEIWGRNFSNPIGLAAGFDKNAEAVESLLGLGSGFVEIGSVTPMPQQGMPRIFRLCPEGAVINRCGFNSEGIIAVAKRLGAQHGKRKMEETSSSGISHNEVKQGGKAGPGILGVNIGKNKASQDAAADYVQGVHTLSQFADYLVINVSSPNTPGLRKLQGRKQLKDLVKKVQAARDEMQWAEEGPPPLLVKIAPDLSKQDLEDIAMVAVSLRLDGLDAPVLPPTALKSALKRAKPADSRSEVGGAQKRLRFKTTTDATTAQVVEAMQKIASHIKNPSKFVKASKLAIHLIESGSVKDGTSDLYFSILDAAMVSSDASVNLSLRADYRALFSAAHDIKELLSKKQKNCLTTWTLKVVVGNDLYTGDSFVFSKAAGKIKEAIDCLPFATKDEDAEEAASLEKVEETGIASLQDPKNSTSNHLPQKNSDTFDPFGLDALLPGKSNKYEKTRGNKEAFVSKHKTDGKDESRRFLKSQREVLILCLETAARRYKTPWTQTVIDILVKHAFDNASKFTSRQRDAIEKLWNSVKEQQIRRKQGKSVTGKLDMNGFEFLQEKYANEKISIRHSVGGGGERRAQQWLG